MQNEQLRFQQIRGDFEEVTSVLVRLFPHSADPDIGMIETGSPEGASMMIPAWDDTIRRLPLSPEVAVAAGLGDEVRCRIIGDHETGVAIIMRSRNLFNTERTGFYLQPVKGEEPTMPRALEVYQGPAKAPKRNRLYWGHELIDGDRAQSVSRDVVKGLLVSLERYSRQSR